MANKIIQWNCRGIKANFNELLLLISAMSPAVICLQETFLKSSDNLKVRHYTDYNLVTDNPNRACGGTSILVNNKIPQSKIDLQTDLQAVAITATLHRTISICSIYIPPGDPIDDTEIENLIGQLPRPFILLGDFNSHSTMWGCRSTDRKGSSLENIIQNNNICLFNNGNSTYFHPATGTYSAIDLSLSDPSVYLDYSWSVDDDTCGSDHFPVILEHSGPDITSKIPRWNLKKANWEQFQLLCKEKLSSKNEEVEDQMTYFTKTLLSITEECVPKTPTKYNRPWFDDDCKDSLSYSEGYSRNNCNPPQDGIFIVFYKVVGD